MTYMNWQQQTENRIVELAQEINDLVAGGVEKEQAIKMVKAETTVSAQSWQQVLQLVG